ncbi:MAG: hypothetical protein IIC55_08890 [Proteobacteria bacterium]|nr:hypothetical protein [Pseudomonadota bacterium]
MQTDTITPHINLIEGCGRGDDSSFTGKPGRNYLEPTLEDINVHRFTMGSALLGDGFYEYNLYDNRSAPYWFDEYTVDQTGVACHTGRRNCFFNAVRDGEVSVIADVETDPKDLYD